jgi:hypothetical protein
MIKEYTFNTGVKPFDFDPPAGMAFMKGFRDSGNGVYVIPFKCEEVPKEYRPTIGVSIPFPNMKNAILREVLPGSAMLSKYVYFTKI